MPGQHPAENAIWPELQQLEDRPADLSESSTADRALNDFLRPRDADGGQDEGRDRSGGHTLKLGQDAGAEVSVVTIVQWPSMPERSSGRRQGQGGGAVAQVVKPHGWESGGFDGGGEAMTDLAGSVRR